MYLEKLGEAPYASILYADWAKELRGSVLSSEQNPRGEEQASMDKLMMMEKLGEAPYASILYGAWAKPLRTEVYEFFFRLQEDTERSTEGKIFSLGEKTPVSLEDFTDKLGEVPYASILYAGWAKGFRSSIIDQSQELLLSSAENAFDLDGVAVYMDHVCDFPYASILYSDWAKDFRCLALPQDSLCTLVGIMCAATVVHGLMRLETISGTMSFLSIMCMGFVARYPAVSGYCAARTCSNPHPLSSCLCLCTHPLSSCLCADLLYQCHLSRVL
jgi:hypothetical protein